MTTTEAARLDLSKFSANETDPREYLRQPWRRGAWVYATNGHVCVRVPAESQPDVAEHEGKTANAWEHFSKHLEGTPGEFSLMPPIPAPMECAGCDGAGWVYAKPCDHCDGDGSLIHKGHEYDCAECLSEFNPAPAGWLATGIEGDTKKVCNDCGGVGFKRLQRFNLGGVDFDVGYLAWMAQLPQCRFRVTTDKNPGVFIGDGWQALVMPMRPEIGMM